MTRLERKVIARMKRIARNKPETRHLTLKFVRDWAFGNAGLENENITRQQADRVIQRAYKKA